MFDDFAEKIADNWLVLATMLTCLAVYAAGMVYAAKKDKDDKLEVSIHVNDNVNALCVQSMSSSDIEHAFCTRRGERERESHRTCKPITWCDGGKPNLQK